MGITTRGDGITGLIGVLVSKIIGGIITTGDGIVGFTTLFGALLTIILTTHYLITAIITTQTYEEDEEITHTTIGTEHTQDNRTPHLDDVMLEQLAQTTTLTTIIHVLEETIQLKVLKEQLLDLDVQLQILNRQDLELVHDKKHTLHLEQIHLDQEEHNPLDQKPTLPQVEIVAHLKGRTTLAHQTLDHLEVVVQEAEEEARNNHPNI